MTTACACFIANNAGSNVPRSIKNLQVLNEIDSSPALGGPALLRCMDQRDGDQYCSELLSHTEDYCEAELRGLRLPYYVSLGELVSKGVADGPWKIW